MTATGPSRRMLEFRSGGWVLLLAVLIALSMVVGRVVMLWPQLGQRAVGDGRTLASYGFDLTHLSVPPELLVPAGPDLPKDGLPALLMPPYVAAASLKPNERLAGVRDLNPSDRVIGVEFNGVARAYPLWVMNWHEIMNDEVGGYPIAVTYSPLCDSVVVFDRRVQDEMLIFGVSGLLFNSNLVMYDRRAPGAGASESLWSQLQFRAIAGPAATRNATLTILPAALCGWEAWRAAHPDTSVVTPLPARKRLYRRDAYSHYFGIDTLFYPVAPLPPPGRALKTAMVARRVGSRWSILDRSSARGEPALPAEQVYAFWFAWHALQGE